MTFFSAPDDAVRALGPFDAMITFWSSALKQAPAMTTPAAMTAALEVPLAALDWMQHAMTVWARAFDMADAGPVAELAPEETAPAVMPVLPVASNANEAGIAPVLAAAAGAAPAKPVRTLPVAKAPVRDIAIPPAPEAELPAAVLADVSPARPATAAGRVLPKAAAAGPKAEVACATTSPDTLAAIVAAIEPEDFKRPARAAKPKSVDDLRKISGIGPKIEKALNGLGIFTYAQIAAWEPAEIAWVDDYVGFNGRIVRDDWLGQASALAKGGREAYVPVPGRESR